MEKNPKNHWTGINCLIIDDDKFSRAFIKTALYQIGIKNVKEAASTDEAMEILEAVSIDLIFLDQIMPEKTGIEFAVELKQSTKPGLKNIPIIMITVDTKEKTVLDAKSLGIVEYLVKPISPKLPEKPHLRCIGIKKNNRVISWTSIFIFYYCQFCRD